MTMEPCIAPCTDGLLAVLDRPLRHIGNADTGDIDIKEISHLTRDVLEPVTTLCSAC